MKIDLATLKRIAKAAPDLTMAQFVAVWSEKLEDQRREIERERIEAKRQQPATPANNEPTSCNTDQHPPTRAELEKQLFADAKSICGKNSGGLVASLLKAHRQDIAACRGVLETARTKSDPREYVAAACRRGNGTTTGLMDAFDDLIDRAGRGSIGGDSEMVDVTPRGTSSG